MTLWRNPTSNDKRRPSMRGVVMFDVTHGKERVRAWPRPRNDGGTPAQKAQREWFRQASWAIKYFTPDMMGQIMEARQGLPILPRDLGMMLLSGRLAAYPTKTGKVVYPMAAVQDVSESLDVLSAIPGYTLVRGTDYWQAVPFPTPGNAWWWAPPDPTAWTLASGDGTNLTWSWDALNGLSIDLGTPLSGGRVRIIDTPITFPAQPFTVEAQATWLNQNVNDAGVALFLRNTGNGRLMMISANSRGEMQLGKWNSLSSYNTSVATLNFSTTKQPNFWRFRTAAGTLFLELSCDGKTWWSAFSEALTTFLGNTNLRAGVGGWHNRTTGGRVLLNVGRFVITN